MNRYEVQMMITFRGKATMNGETEEEAIENALKHINSEPIQCTPMAVESVEPIHVKKIVSPGPMLNTKGYVPPGTFC